MFSAQRTFIFLLFFSNTLLKAQHECCHRAKEPLALTADISLMNQADDQNIDIIYVKYDYQIDPNVAAIEGNVELFFLSKIESLIEIYLQLSTKLKVDSIKSDAKKLLFTHQNEFDLKISLDQITGLNQIKNVKIYYKGNPPSNGFGSYTNSVHQGQPLLFTFSVPYGSRDWWPCKNGNEDKLDSIEMKITTPSAYRAASNGKLVKEEILLADKKTYIWKHNYPIVPYLVAFAVTNYKAYTDELTFYDGTKMEVLNFVYPESIVPAKLGTKKLLDALYYYDSLLISYPFRKEKYGHAQFSWGGGMEHQTMSFVTNFEFGLLAHELAHQWFGDMVTCASWSDVWLNEGFATYMEGLAQERFNPGNWQAWKSNKIANVTSSTTGSVYVKDTTNINRIFNGRLTYDKGALILHQLRWLLGDEIFFGSIKNYLNKIGYGFATTQDLKTEMEVLSGINLDEYFNDYFLGEGYPRFNIKWEARPDNKVALLISQTQSSNKVSFYEMDLPIKFSGEGQSFISRLSFIKNQSYFEVELPFNCVKVEFDPSKWLISGGNIVTKTQVTSNEEEVVNSVSLHPNPATEFLLVKGQSENFEYRIYDYSGKKILFGQNNGSEPIDIRGLQNGFYTFKKKDDIHGFTFVINNK